MISPDPEQARVYLQHRAALMAILNNADGYVTIDGDPGSYPGAKPSDFLKVFLADRQTLDRAGERPEKQKLIPWIWSGWGTKGVWVEPIEPYVQATLAELKRGMPEFRQCPAAGDGDSQSVLLCPLRRRAVLSVAAG